MEFEGKVMEYIDKGPAVNGDGMNPVEYERGQSYVRFDGVRVGNSTDAVGGVSVQFTYKGAAVAWFRIEGAKLSTIRHQYVDGMSGRLKVFSNK